MKVYWWFLIFKSDHFLSSLYFEVVVHFKGYIYKYGILKTYVFKIINIQVNKCRVLKKGNYSDTILFMYYLVDSYYFIR